MHLIILLIQLIDLNSILFQPTLFTNSYFLFQYVKCTMVCYHLIHCVSLSIEIQVMPFQQNAHQSWPIRLEDSSHR
jgi:hypothetical protein